MIAIVKYNGGNAVSIQNALYRLGYKSCITNDIRIIQNADKVIFPGVGQASTAMQFLYEHKLDKELIKLTQPFLGICLGLQLMCEYSEEGNTTCSGIFPSKVKRFTGSIKIPHMGWNTLKFGNQPIFKDLNNKNDMYFVHSYYAEVCKNTTAICSYEGEFSAALQKDNFFATQFHPEKSGKFGECVLKNFCKL